MDAQILSRLLWMRFLRRRYHRQSRYSAGNKLRQARSDSTNYRPFSVPPLVYALFGSSNNMAVGPVAAASLLMAAIIQEIVSPEEEPERYVYTIITAAFFTGLLQLTLGIFRLGIIVDFLARSTITGFMGGTAMIIILQQLKGFLGLKHFTNKTDVISVLHAIFDHRSECKWQSAVLGIGLLIFLLFARQLKKKIPKLFWVNAVAPLVVVIVGGVIAFLVDGESHGIPIVGDLKRGLNPITLSNLQFKSPYVSVAVKAGIITGFIALAEGVAVGRSLALLKNEQIDGNKEMIAFGLMNIAGSFTSCYLTTGPFSKSAVNYHAGCKTPMSNAVMSVCMMLVLLFLAPLFKYTPLVALAVIIIVAMIGVIELHELRHLFNVDKFDFCLCMAALLGVLFINMKTGLAISFLLSIIRALLHVARPVTCKLGNLPGTDLYRDIDQYPDSTTISGILILQLGSPIYFANASYLRERIARWVEAEENRIKETRSQDIQYMAITNPSLKVVEKFTVANFIEAVGKEWFFISVNDAVAGCHFAMQEANETGV
ncbi:hypothetical protein IEQ34_019489 [Dendrobium chrysotoxum]|uniref:STAS domain-containing protein n=1 Tax=Dendrobium chrysotoxum TaxID=161865 RepID=A0AAV7FRE9_DENCH|nr:hypothetical protein IEQ34_019489 [Dendrobium chrysotoxum]